MEVLAPPILARPSNRRGTTHMASGESPSVGSARRWWRELELWLAIALVVAIYFPRLTALTIRGEESRRAQVATEMLRTGNWIVPRQQGEIYLSRPPLGSWLIALAALAVGDVTPLAVRLPAALSTLATAILCYYYARRWLTPPAAMMSGLAFATMAQVLELGGLAETEATLTVLMASSLLLWHAAWSARRPYLAWTIGYSFAALAGLAKGPQGPVYFFAVTSMFLCTAGAWRGLFTRAHALGIGMFVLVLGVWQLPFYLQTDWASVHGIWWNNAADRFAETNGLALLKHLAIYPLEVATCTLPWFPLTFGLIYPAVRRRLAETMTMPWFLLVALAVTFPTCWMAATARGRYFMPMYPCIALLGGLVVDRVTNFPGEDARHVLRRFFLPFTVALAAAALALLAAAMAPVTLDGAARAAFSQPILTACASAACGVAAWAAWRVSRTASAANVRTAVLAIAASLGLIHAGPLTDVRVAASEDTAALVAAVKAGLPPAERTRLVSLGRVHHLFAYHYRDPIRMIDAAARTPPVDDEWEYFCFDQPGRDPAELPFDWTPVAVVSCHRNRVSVPVDKVIVGRRIRGTATAGRGTAAGRK